MTDVIRLVVPAQEAFRRVANLVVGGLGARLHLTYEDLDDLQTALAAVLAQRNDDGEVTVLIEVSGETVRSSVGPFTDGQIGDLERESDALGLRRVLTTVADAFEVERRDGSAYVVVTKHTAATAGAAG